MHFNILAMFSISTKKKLEGGDHDNDEGWRRGKMTCRKFKKYVS